MKKTVFPFLLCLLVFLGSFYFLSYFSLTQSHTAPETTKFVFIVTSYNNAKYYMKNLSSLLTQKYSKFRIIYVDDNSPDGTANLVEAYIKEHNPYNIPVLLIRQPDRRLKMHNFYQAMQHVEEDEVALDMDGDDWLAHEFVLQKLNQVYQDKNIWATYGNYILVEDSPSRRGYCYPFERWVINRNAYRDVPLRATHLKTFYGWLFKRIDVNAFMDNGEFLPSTADFACMFPILELTGGRFTCIRDVLYIYNNKNPISDRVVDAPLQTHCFKIIQNKPRYNGVQEHEIPDFLKKPA